MSLPAIGPHSDVWRFRAPLAPSLRRGAWCAIPVTIALLLDIKLSAPVAGAIASGALLAGFVAFDAPARTRFAWQLIAAPAIGAAAGLGVLTDAAPTAVAVATMVLVALGAGLCVAVSMRLAIAAINVVLALLIAQGTLLLPDDALYVSALAAVGALAQATFSLIAWLGTAERERHEPISEGAAGAVGRLRSNLDLTSHSLRHALRWAGALGAGVAFYRLIGPHDHGFWIPLTVLFVLKPEFDDTIERIAMRAAGTIAGLILATALAPLATGHPIPAAIILGTAAAFGLALLLVEYALFTFAFTTFVVLLADVLGEDAFQTAGERAIGTVVGIAIAFAAIWIFPSVPRSRKERPEASRTMPEEGLEPPTRGL